ncbi:unnamed protein product, partial [Thelazia callipaeda]|uniref:Reverse transcriptase domain-containing protein n=1 Tax=Thelazia callipaeda TaxID=103827 RepID=A0A0N5CNJ0_THECL
EDGAKNVVECVEDNHSSNTYRNNTKYVNVPSRISNLQNKMNLVNLSKVMIESVASKFQPNPLLYNLY